MNARLLLWLYEMHMLRLQGTLEGHCKCSGFELSPVVTENAFDVLEYYIYLAEWIYEGSRTIVLSEAGLSWRIVRGAYRPLWQGVGNINVTTKLM